MNLEALIEANTKALLALTARLEAAAPTYAPSAPPPVQPLVQPKAEVKAPVQPTPAGTTALTYEKDVKPAALALAKKDREKLSEIWAKLAVKVGTELKVEQLAEAKKLIEEASK